MFNHYLRRIITPLRIVPHASGQRGLQPRGCFPDSHLSTCLVTMFSLMAGLALTTGCESAPKYKDLKQFVQDKPDEQEVSATNYRLEPPDVISISSPTAPEIDGETQMLRSDGRISLKLLGEVKVAGLTPRETAAKLEELLARYYTSPQVNVRVSAFNSKTIYVFGQVAGGGKMAYTGRDTVLDVVARAQPTFLGWGSRVQVIRPSADPDKRHVVTVDTDKMTQTGDLKDNFLLKEGDVVYVPPTPLGWVGLRVRELFWPFEPVYSAYTQGYQVRNAHDGWSGDLNSGGSNDNEIRRQAMMLMLR